MSKRTKRSILDKALGSISTKRGRKGKGLVGMAPTISGRKKGRGISTGLVGAFEKASRRSGRRHKSSIGGILGALGDRMTRTERMGQFLEEHDYKRNKRLGVFKYLASQSKEERWGTWLEMSGEYSQRFRNWVQDTMIEFEKEDIQDIVRQIPNMTHSERWTMYEELRKHGLNGRRLPSAVVTYIRDEIQDTEHPIRDRSWFSRLMDRVRFGKDD